MAEAVSDYSLLDRSLHRLAFASPNVQLVAADLEKSLYGAAYRNAPAQNPIFITSLPRSGTTMILAALHELPTMATHVYRDMPFVLAPVLWNRLSEGFRKQSLLRERAHGDGVKIGFDSPEAFEEIFWRAFWPEKYGNACIELWTSADRKEEALEFLGDHIRKIVLLRCGSRFAEGRYVSKNNANIARIDLIAAALPGSRIVVPVRRPLDHAASMLLQHRNFLAIHRKEKFSVTYMADIGHYEFGALHKPIAFPGFSAARGSLQPDDVNYWLAYWISAFEYVLARIEKVIAVSYEDICDRRIDGFRDLCRSLGIDVEDKLDKLAEGFRPPVSHDVISSDANPTLRERALQLYAELSRSWVGSSPGR